MNSQVRSVIDNLADTVHKLMPESNNNKNLVSSFKKAGIQIKYFVDKNYDSFLTWDYNNNEPIISLNATKPPRRMNFSIAHELGHLVINYHWFPGADNSHISRHRVLSTEYRGGKYDTVKQRKNEMVMDEFAAAFLVPDDLLAKIVNDDDNYNKAISRISNRFNVSEQAAQIRLDNYNARSDING